MKIVINGQQVVGNLEDIAKLLEYFNPAQGAKKIPVTDGLEDMVKQSEALRAQLATDPNFNPFGGVVASTEPNVANNVQPTTQRQYSADADTGISYE